MSLGVAISIKSKWVADIINGIKKYEIRSTKPNCYLPVEVFVYCCQGNDRLWKENDYYWHSTKVGKTQNDLNGKVVAKFTLKNCKDWHNYSWQDILEKGCVSDQELKDYSKNKKTLYIWEISDLVVFDRPKDLSELSTCSLGRFNCYMKRCDGKSCPCFKPLLKAPQSWCYVEGR